MLAEVKQVRWYDVLEVAFRPFDSPLVLVSARINTNWSKEVAFAKYKCIPCDFMKCYESSGVELELKL